MSDVPLFEWVTMSNGRQKMKVARGEPIRLVRAAFPERETPFTVSWLADRVPQVSRARVFDLVCELTYARHELEEIARGPGGIRRFQVPPQRPLRERLADLEGPDRARMWNWINGHAGAKGDKFRPWLEGMMVEWLDQHGG